VRIVSFPKVLFVRSLLMLVVFWCLLFCSVWL